MCACTFSFAGRRPRTSWASSSVHVWASSALCHCSRWRTPTGNGMGASPHMHTRTYTRKISQPFGQVHARALRRRRHWVSMCKHYECIFERLCVIFIACVCVCVHFGSCIFYFNFYSRLIDPFSSFSSCCCTNAHYWAAHHPPACAPCFVFQQHAVVGMESMHALFFF